MIEYALEMARRMPYKRGEQRHYCVILDKRGRKLAESGNSYIKSSPKMMRAAERVGLKEKIYWHAECKAIYSIKDVNRAHKLIVARVDSKGNSVNSEPCCICAALIKDVGVKIIEYSL